MDKEGVSTVVAIALTMVITASGVCVIWGFFSVVVDYDSFDVNTDVSLDVVSSGEYTAWDPANLLSMVRIERGSDDSDLIGLDLIYYFEKHSVKHYVLDVPIINVMKTYYVNLSGYPDALVSIGVAPVFVGEVIGSVIGRLDVGDIPEVDILALIDSGEISGDLFDLLNDGVILGACSEEESIERGTCLDGVDNDCDLYVDCDDSGCYGHYSCCSNVVQDGDEDGVDCGGSCVSGVESGSCTGGVDDDNDCLVDCADSDCFDDVACVVGCSGTPHTCSVFTKKNDCDDHGEGCLWSKSWKVCQGTHNPCSTYVDDPTCVSHVCVWG